jgi:hypothetical protein
MLFQQLVTRCVFNRFVAILLTSCENAVPTSTRCVLNRLVASLLPDVTMLFRQLVNMICSQQACSKLVNKF